MIVSGLGLSSCTTGGTHGSATVTNAPVAGANNVQVVLTIPPSWHPMLEERTDDAFVSHLSDIFQQAGFQGNLVDVRYPDQPNSAYPILAINVTDWRMNVTGEVECDFTATLQTQNSVQPLGSFNGISIRWMNGPGRFGLADTYGAAADDALRQLYNAIARTRTLPGFVSR